MFARGASLRGDGVLLSFERGPKRMPGERGAFHAHRIFGNSRKGRQLAEFFRFRAVLSSNDVMEFLKELLGLFFILALDGLGHHGSRSLRNRAARALEGDIANLSIITKLQEDREMIAAKRVETLGLAIG